MVVSEQILVDIKTIAEIRQLAKYRTELTAMQKAGANVTPQLNRLTKATKGLEEEMDAAASTMKRFRFEGLNILFFGMFLQRTFGGIQRSALDTFRRISEGGEGAGTAITALSAEFEFLKFTIGDAISTALEPFLPMIINIIRGIADFIEQHPQIALLIVAIAALGGVMVALGAAMVFFQNIPIAATFVKLISGLAGAIPVATGLSVALGPILIAIALIAGAVILLFLAWQNNWFGIRDIVKGVLDFITPPLQFLGTVIELLKKIFVAFFTIAGKVVEIFFAIIKIPFDFVIGFLEGLGIDLGPLKKAWTDFWSGASNIVEGAWKIIGPIFEAIGRFLDIIKAGLGLLGNIAGGAGRAIGSIISGNGIPSFQTGGIMPNTGLAYLHAGERITPAGQSSSAGNITVQITTGPISSDVDVKRMATLVGDEIMRRVHMITPSTTRYL